MEKELEAALEHSDKLAQASSDGRAILQEAYDRLA